MRGIITIRKGDEVVFREDNLIVDGAAENIVDLLTAPPHVSGGLEDASSYIVQAATVGTTQQAYLSNLHAYKKHNLIRGTDSNSYWRLTGTAQMFEAEGYFNIISGAEDDAVKTPLLGDYLSRSLSGDPISFSVDLRYDYQLPIASASDGRSYTTVSGSVWGNEVAVNLRWDPSGIPTMVDKQNAYIKKLADDWYRVCLVPSSVTSPTSSLSFGIVIAGDASQNTLITTGGEYGRLDMRRPSINVGSVPVNYYLSSTTDEFTFASENNTFPLISSSVVNGHRHGVHFLSGQGSITSDTSAYNLSASYPTTPTPYDTYGQQYTETPYEANTHLVLPKGHNLGISIYEGVVPDIPMAHYVEGWTSGTDLSAQPVFADMRWISGWCPTDMTYHLVSGIDQYDKPVTTLSHSTTTLAADTSAVDQNGYWKVAYPESFTGSNPNYATGTDSYVRVSYDPTNFSSTGEIDFTLSATAQDRRWADLMGGIFTLGLHVPGWRMIAKKVFNFPITFLPDEGTTAGAEDERELKVTWTLKVIEE